MISIMDAIESAQKRSAQRDAMNQSRIGTEIAPIAPVQEILPVQYGGSDGPEFEDTRTPGEMYRDAVKVNKFASALGPLGTPVQLMNDAYIQQYEAKNPNNILPGQRYSTVGRLLGFGDPGSTGITGVFGENRDLYNAGLFDLSDDDQRPGISFGARGDAYRAETGGGMGPAQSGPQEEYGP
jgi:hypothetical protein